jgi:hypothetical protein
MAAQTKEEVVMLQVRRVSTLLGLSIAAAVIMFGVPNVTAQQKISYEQAYAQCQADIKRTFPAGSTDTAGRNSRGAACMKDKGFNLKKGDAF